MPQIPDILALTILAVFIGLMVGLVVLTHRGGGL